MKYEKHSRAISNSARVGFGYRIIDGKKQYFAYHGYWNKNDDYFTTAEISKGEYLEIETEYPGEHHMDPVEAEAFRKKYIHDHPVILEGWNELL